MKFKTDAFARIKCEECHEVVATLMPGEAFDSIPDCKCSAVPVFTLDPDTNIEELRAMLKNMKVSFSPQAKEPTLIKKIEEARNG